MEKVSINYLNLQYFIEIYRASVSKDKIRLFLLPRYSPELNPDELANQDIKRNIFRDGKAKDKPELMGKLRGFLRSRQRRPHKVKKYFEGKYVAYAKAA